MESANFDESNTHLGAPPGMSCDLVAPLCVYRTTHPNAVPQVISCWKPTRAELDEIQRTGRVWLRVMGETMPPVVIEGFSPFKKGSADG